MAGWRRTAWCTALGTIVLGACGGWEIDLPDAAQVPPPSFVAAPDDLADSFQLAAMPIRETAGLLPDGPSASAEWLPEALAALAAAVDPAPTTLSRLSIFGDTIHFTVPDPAVAGRSISTVYRHGDELYIGDPQFDDSEPFPLAAVDPTVPARLVAAIESRFPSVRVTDFDLDRDLSYDFGLVWYVSVDDARGQVATVFADLDGAIVGVDAW